MANYNDDLLPVFRNLSGKESGLRASSKPKAPVERLLTPDADLALIVGPDPMTRFEIVRRLWDYVRKNNLQDADDWRIIRPDNKLGKVLNGRHTAKVIDVTRCVLNHTNK